MGPHIGNDLVADFLEGLLSDAEAARVHEHLAACGSCQAVADSLSEVRLLLRDGGAQSGSMPMAVSDRLEAVIGAESSARAADASYAFDTNDADSASDSPCTPETVGGSESARARVRGMSPPGARRAQRRRPRWVPALAAAASVAALALGSGVVYSTLSTDQPPSAQGGGPSVKSEGAGPDRPTTFGFRNGGDSTLSASNFAGQVEALVEPKASPSPSPSKSLGARPPGIIGENRTQRCVTFNLEKAKAGKLLGTRSAELDGQLVTLALTETDESGVVRAYAIKCGMNEGIVRSAAIHTR
jgi:hypothetical protein